MKWLVDEMVSWWNGELSKCQVDEMTSWWIDKRHLDIEKMAIHGQIDKVASWQNA